MTGQGQTATSFLPESIVSETKGGRSSDSFLSLANLPEPILLGSVVSLALLIQKKSELKLTAPGSVHDFHMIPF